MEQSPPNFSEDQHFPILSSPESSFIDRHGISPVLFAFLSLILVFFTYQIIGGLLTILLFGTTPTEENVFAFRIATGIGQILLLFIPAMMLTQLAAKSPKVFLRVRAPDWRTIGLSLVGIFTLQQMLQIYLVFQEKLPLPEELQDQLQHLKDAIEELYRVIVSSTSSSELLLVVFIIAVIPAIAEEFLFRGLIQRSFQRSVGPARSIIITGIIFGAFHLNPFAIIPLIGLGLYLGFVAYRGDSIWVSVAAHFFNNAIAGIAVFFQLNDDATVIGDPANMSLAELFGTFWFFGVIFLISTYYFVHITREKHDDPHEPEEV